MFTIEDKKKLEKAIARAKELSPKVKLVCAGEHFCEYEVSGSQGDEYAVSIIGYSSENIIIICECPTRNGVPCKHGVAALFEHHRIVARIQQSDH